MAEGVTADATGPHVAIAWGALDVRAHSHGFSAGSEVALLPTVPSEPIGLSGDPAALWRRLVDGPVDPAELSPEERDLLGEFVVAGIASERLDHPARVTALAAPWFVSGLHELVSALVVGLARESGIGAVLVKGPMLRKQGLRSRKHSGDVDVWVDPARVDELVELVLPWGWARVPTAWDGTEFFHSVTLRPEVWGCEIDVHRDFPGVGVGRAGAFAYVAEHSEEAVFAGSVGRVPVRGLHAVIAALHVARPAWAGRGSASQFDDSVAVLSGAGADVVGHVNGLGAGAALTAQLAELGLSGVEAGRLPQNWEWFTKSSPSRGYLFALRSIPWRHRARVLWRLLWPSREGVKASDRRWGGSGSGVALSRIRRIGRATSMMFSGDPVGSSAVEVHHNGTDSSGTG